MSRFKYPNCWRIYERDYLLSPAQRGEQNVCRVEVRPSRQPVYAQGKQTADFYVRLNNGTRSLDIEEAVDYISVHDWAHR